MKTLLKDSFNDYNFVTLFLMLFLFTIPYGYALNSIIFGIFCFGSIFFFLPKAKDFINFPLVFLLPLFYIYIFFVCLINNEIIESANFLNLYLPFLAAPLLYFSLKTKKTLQTVFVTLIITVIFFAIICYAMVFYDMLTTHRNLSLFFSWWYTNNNLVKYTALHTTYAGLSVNLGIASIFILKKRHRHLFKKLAWFLPLLILFNFSIASRMQSIILILICVIFLLSLKTKWFIKLSILIIILLIPFILYLISPYISHKINGLFNTENYKNVSEVKDPASFDARISFFKSGFKTALHAPLLGYGMSNGRKKLDTGFKEDKLDWVLKKRFNAHNQYIEYAIRLGILGLLIFIFLFVAPLYYCLKSKNDMLPYALFSIIFLFSFLSESILLRQKGVILFTFIYTVLIKLIYSNRYENKKNNYISNKCRKPNIILLCLVAFLAFSLRLSWP